MSTPKVVLETGVLISAFITEHKQGVSSELVRAAELGTFRLYLSDDILAEPSAFYSRIAAICGGGIGTAIKPRSTGVVQLPESPTSWPILRRTSSARLRGVSRAFLWMSIRAPLDN